MRKGLTTFSPVFLFVSLSGCVSGLPYENTATYDITLSEVERPKEAKIRYGDLTITPVDENGNHKYSFEDEMVKILFFPSPVQIEFLLNNKTDHSIKIVWDDASYVDGNGVGHRVLHEGTRLVDRNAPQAPTVVIRRGAVSDMIYPSDYVEWTGRDWYHKPLLPTNTAHWPYPVITPDELEKNANAAVGKTIQVLLPLQIEDIVNEYIFSFGVNKVTMGCKIIGRDGTFSGDDCKIKQ